MDKCCHSERIPFYFICTWICSCNSQWILQVNQIYLCKEIILLQKEIIIHFTLIIPSLLLFASTYKIFTENVWLIGMNMHMLKLHSQVHFSDNVRPHWISKSVYEWWLVKLVGSISLCGLMVSSQLSDGSTRRWFNSPTPTPQHIKSSRGVGELVLNPIQLIRS